MNMYSRVSYEERCQIATLLQAKISIPKIAILLKRNKSTIYREIKRNSSKNEYRSIGAEKRASARFKRCRRKKLLDFDLIKQIEEKLYLFWSPEQIFGRFKQENKFMVSTETIYKHIRQHWQLKSKTRFMSTRQGGGRRKRKKRQRDSRLSIHNRPMIINNKERFGDWERDGMFGANGKELLVCTERKSKYTKLAIINDQSSAAVNLLTLKLIREVGGEIHSITNDNGPEFLKQTYLEEIPVYYCDPMRPDQRGLIENTIGVLRKQITRKTDLIKLGDLYIKEIEKNFNLIPRKVLGFKTPHEVLNKVKVALAI